MSPIAVHFLQKRRHAAPGERPSLRWQLIGNHNNSLFTTVYVFLLWIHTSDCFFHYVSVRAGTHPGQEISETEQAPSRRQ